MMPNPVTAPLVISEPEINTRDVDDDDEFIVLASDGLYDVFSDQEIVDFIRYKILLLYQFYCYSSSDVNKVPNLQTVTENLVENAIETQGSRDNVTVILVALNQIPSWKS